MIDWSNWLGTGSIKVWSLRARVPSLIDVVDKLRVGASLESKVISRASFEELRIAIECDTDRETALGWRIASKARGRVLELKNGLRCKRCKEEVLLKEVHHVDNLGIVSRVDEVFEI